MLITQDVVPPGRRAQLALVLGSLSAFGALTIDMYLPAMPGMAGELHTSPLQVQLTLTVFVVGLALGQVIVGPLSDAWGRRRPLLAGLILYVAGSLWCALAPGVGWLLAGRVLQSLGAAAGTVLARAVVRDLYEGTAMTRFFSTLMVVNGVAPIVAPVIGGQLLTFTTWRAVFGVLAAIGAVLLIAVVFTLPESLPGDRRAPAHPGATLRTFRTLGTDRHYLRYVLAAALMFAAVFAYISGSSFVLQEAYGLSAQQFSIVFAVNGLGIILCGQLNRMLVGRVADEHTLLRISLAVAVLGSAGVLACALFDLPLALLLICLFLLVSMLGIVLADATSLALAGHASAAGAASSLQGLLQFLVGSLAAAAMNLSGHVTATAMGATMVVCSTAALAVLHLRGPR
ncbi:Bcr/CflA family drug resistance efflux transporter [Actinoplanes lobatus]|uniref:Bcr/CflA family drug resistance efflux transporter n=1 Tax=Actinoplanes lobatus TaxID=113568 RepID=A0A7W7HJH6_9ACTN|nr:multidrug effflux MFS transporter [Actinoplanes lobatus]MBB4751685.1 DHA1 family bicyclomycin/chloramphenicol resistance-like MFS transporter [Actinoplanes lobatus]GGN65277.1 Bcr/CflA family drug resistance efflux transporter [Actinoplanes lobatus]GIE43268.1 Bcr/CflA family drug resistance efflux transporter [Actinoplanes lobatus]